MTRGSLLLGLDGGGTHTRAVLAGLEGDVLGRGRAGPSNWATGGADAARRALAEAIGQALAGHAPQEVRAACLGLAGLDRPQDAAAYRPVPDAWGLGERTLLVNDAEIAWAGATGGAPGIVVVAGTGSVAYGRDGAGRAARAGGWGLPFGDEGGAAWIAAEAIRRVLCGSDGRARPSALASVLCAAAGCADPLDLCRLPGGGTAETALGALAPAVTAAAAGGEPDALRIVERAAGELAGLAGGVAAQLGLTRPAVHGLGSVLAPLARPFPAAPVARTLSTELRRVLGVPLVPPRHPALVGALVLAYGRAAGTPPPAEVMRRWEQGLP